jgi:probable O-glycosylation ligase (exosortase A-associated)
MRDLAFVGFLVLLLGFGLRRPFVLVLGYAYIDIVSPQRLSYYLLNAVPISQIFFLAALLGWLVADRKAGTPLSVRQLLFALLLIWSGWTTLHADFPIDAQVKWDWVSKVLIFAVFLPLTLRTRLRLEALLVIIVLSGASIIITGGIKTLASGGGYGVLNLGVDNNTGLYEGSIVSTFAIALIPLILYLRKYGTIFPTDWRVNLFCGALIFACLLIPIGTEARTGLLCMVALAGFMLRDVKRRFLYVGLAAVAALITVPLLPASFTQRMDTIQGYQGDTSASTRIAVWRWTWDYVQEHPLGGGFDAYRQNSFRYQTVSTQTVGNTTVVSTGIQTDAARAYHSSYFEMLGEQGWPGFIMWSLLHLIGLVRMEVLRRRYRRAAGDKGWISPFATALQTAQLIYLVGSLFVGIAFQSFVYMWMGLQIGLDAWVRRQERSERQRPFVKPQLAPAAS